MLKDIGDHLLAEIRYLVPVDSVSIHDTDYPKAWNLATQFLLYAVTVLVDFAHLWDEPSA